MGMEGWLPGVGSVIQGASGFAGQLAANRANKKMHQKQLDWNEQMWHMSNQYNTPAAQMQRYRDAGLNTALMYGQGSEGNASSAPAPATPPTMQNAGAALGAGVQSGIGSYIAMKKVDAEIENIRADTHMKLTGADKDAVTTEGIAINNARDYQEYMYEMGIYGQRLKRHQIATAIDGLELVKLGLENKSLEIKNARETAELVWKQFNEAIKAAQNVADFNGTILENKITQADLDHMQKWNMKMGTENPLLGTLKALYDEISSDEGEIRRRTRKEERALRNAPANDPRRKDNNLNMFLDLLEMVSKDSTNYN